MLKHKQGIGKRGMSRLPTVGGDEGNWGDILNDYLSVEHNPDGTFKPIEQSKLASDVQAKLNNVDDRIPLAQKGAADGVATLDATSHIPDTQIATEITRDSEVSGVAGAAITSGDTAITDPLDARLALAVKADAPSGVAATDRAMLQTKIAAAVAGIKILDLGANRTYLIDATLNLTTGLMIRGVNVTLKLADGVIVNTDASANNFVPILRVQGVSWFVLDGITFDGNTANQTYPATVNTIGRGTKPWRHNASVEFTPDATNTTASQNILVRNCYFNNGYLSGLSLWQCSNVTVSGGGASSNAWSGIVGCGLTNVRVEKFNGYRNGVHPVYTQARQDGDRATVQFREYDKSLTSANQGLPTIAFTSSQLNSGVRITGIHSIEDAVMAVMLRACKDARITDCKVTNPGYGRPATASYYPAGLWAEWGSYMIDHNVVHVPTNPGSNLQPDGIVCYSFTGDGVEPIGAVGTYESVIERNTIYCGEDYPLSSGVSTDNANKRNNVYRGIRVVSNTAVVGNTIEGTSSYPIQITNDTGFTNGLPINVRIEGGHIRNWLSQGAIYITRTGTPSVAGGKLMVTNTRIEDGRNPNTSLTSNAMVLFDTNCDGQVLDEVIITGNDWDCANSAYPTQPYIGVRHRGASTSKLLKISSNIIRNAYRAWSIPSGVNIETNNNSLDNCGAMFLAAVTGTVGTWTCNGNIATNMTFAVGVFSFTSATINRFVFVGNSFQGTGNTGWSGWTVGDANVTNACLAPNLIRGPGTFDWRRSVSAAPTMNAWYVGEIIYRSDTTPHTYMAITVGSGAADWAPFAA